jgi:hypothetical protein
MKIDNRTFKFAGSSADANGNYKARFANDLEARPKVMTKCGHTNFVLVPLPTPMSKIEAIAYLLATKPEGVNLDCLESKAVYINKQVAKLSGNGTGAKRGRPAKKATVTTAVTPKITKSIETPATLTNATTETPSSERIVSKIVTKARGTSIRSKAAQVVGKIAAAKK